VAPAQIEAISEWGAPRQKSFEYLKSIRQPTLVVNGGNDVIIYAGELVHPAGNTCLTPSLSLYPDGQSRLAVPIPK